MKHKAPSNFSPDPRFIPTPGRPTPAPRPDKVRRYGAGVFLAYSNHRTLEQVDADEAREAWKERYREIARQNLRDWRKKPRG